MLTVLATLCCGLFAGAAGYITFVEHWARIQAGPAVALAQFRPGFPRARGAQASLAVLAAAFSAFAWLGGAGISWLVVSGLMAAIVGFTLVAITPVYNQLLDPSLSADSSETPELLARWGNLHAVRSVLGLVAFLVAIASS